MRNIYIALTLSVILLNSCIDNTTELGTKPISRIKFQEEFSNTAYREDQWNEFTLACPSIEQENEDKPLTYRWDVNYKTVSTEKDLKFVCDELPPADMGSFPCRLTVSNEDGSSYQDFYLKVTSPYEEGLMVMSKTTEGSMLSFKREDKPDVPFQLNAYKRNNPDYPLGEDPVGIVQLNSSTLYIASANPNRIIKLNSKTMEATYLLDYPAGNLNFIGKPNETETYLGLNNTIFCFDNGRLLYLDAGQDGFINHVQQELDKLVLPNKIELANKICLAKKSYLVYDNANSRLFYYDDWYARIVDIQPNDFKGKKLIDFVPCMGGYYNQVIIVEIPGGTPEIILANPPYLSGSPVSTEGTGINSDSKFLGSAKNPHLYYSVGNQIFVYNIYSNGNFEPARYTVGETGDVIKSMVFNSNENKLYVGWESANGGEYKGNVTCFVLSGSSEPWEEKGIAGEIVNMMYKK